jgi:hypothetical protein
MDVCVCLSGADGRVVEGRATLFRHHCEVSRVRIPGRMGWGRPEKRRKEKKGWAWVAGKSTPQPLPHHMRKKEKNKPTAKVPDRPSGERG